MRTIIYILIFLAFLGIAAYFFVSSRSAPSPTPPPPASGLPVGTPADGDGNGADGGEPPPPPTPGRSFSVNLRPQNKSGESGSASITEMGGKVRVDVILTGAPQTAQPAHIHVGSCPTPGAVRYPLSGVVNGRSETTLDVSYDDFLAGLPLAVNVHKSASQANVYVACGDVGLNPILPKG